MGSVELLLPYPPSVNRYWRNVRGRMVTSKAGRDYKRDVLACVLETNSAKQFRRRLSVEIIARPPDKRRRDLDNTLKAALDALGSARVYVDDEQIDAIDLKRGKVCRPDGLLWVCVREL